MLDLILQETAENVALEKHIVRGLGMRLADDSLVRLDFYVWADIIVARVAAHIKAVTDVMGRTDRGTRQTCKRGQEQDLGRDKARLGLD